MTGTPPRRIALVGAECTGKTTLAAALAERLPALWIPERLREFCDEKGRPPRPDEQARLAAEQIERETQAMERAARSGVGWVICDSTPLITALYSIEYFGDDALLAQAVAHQRGYALTLLADVDLPWEADRFLRDGPGARAGFHLRLTRTLAAHGLPHHRVAGGLAARVEAALAATRRL